MQIYYATQRNQTSTLADFWGYKAHNFKSINYNKGTSLIIINSRKGQELINLVKKTIYVEKSNIDTAIRGNKCLKEPFKIDEQKLAEFWHDYENGDGKRTKSKIYSRYIYFAEASGT